MRHKVYGKKLGRDHNHRKALFKNLAKNFFENDGKVKTTLTKAKAVQPLIERMIARAGKGDLVSRRWLFSYFQNQNFVNKIVSTFGAQFSKRHGGYTKIIKLERRPGDNAIVVRLCLSEELIKEKEETGDTKETKRKEKKDKKEVKKIVKKEVSKRKK